MRRGFRQQPPFEPVVPLPLRITRGGVEVLDTRLAPHQPVDIYLPGIHLTMEMDGMGRFVLHQVTTMTHGQ